LAASWVALKAGWMADLRVASTAGMMVFPLAGSRAVPTADATADYLAVPRAAYWADLRVGR